MEFWENLKALDSEKGAELTVGGGIKTENTQRTRQM